MNYSLNTNGVLILFASFAVGLVLGGFYFTTLWQTVQKLPSAVSAARLMLVSFILRMAVVLAGLYLVMGEGHWERLASAMLGFIVVRKIIIHRLGPQKEVQAQAIK